LGKYLPGFEKNILIDIDFKLNLIFTTIPIKFKISRLDIFSLILSLPISVYYYMTRHWLLNNFFGILFSIYGIQNLNLPNFKIAFILLWGLFFYDIFWVYGTDVMVTVAKSIDAPIKLMFPVDLKLTPPKFSILGLGDIVIPGIFVALCIRYDINRVLSKSKNKKSPEEISNIRTPYFNWCLIFYGIGILLTFMVMVVSNSAQPALLYLVPCCCLSVILVGYFEGDLTNVYNYDEEKFEKDEVKIR